MSTTKKCAGPCGLEKTDDKEHFIERGTPAGPRRDSWCRTCRCARLSVQRFAAGEAARESRRAVRTIVCRGPCRREKPATHENFARRPDGTWFYKCRICARAAVAEMRRGPEYARWRTQSRKRRRIILRKYREKNSTRSQRYYAAKKGNPAWERHRKALNFLTAELAAGRVTKPARCQRRGCRRGPPGFRLRAHFTTPDHRLEAIEWLCCPHHWQATSGADYLAQVREDSTPSGHELARAAIAQHERLARRGSRALNGPKHRKALLAALTAGEGEAVEAVEYDEAPLAFPLPRGASRRLGEALQLLPAAVEAFVAAAVAPKQGRGRTYAELCLEQALGVGQGTWRPEDHPAAE